ncbi:MAG: thermonuclease family protein [Gammaproteobacteria bacterium]|nr:MAG: thermonuclease family protein [Gammaproteobacteria bacterium]
MSAPSATPSTPASRKLWTPVAVSTALTSVSPVVQPRNKFMLLAFRGSQNALPAMARSAFFVVRLFAVFPLFLVDTVWAETSCKPFAALEPVSIHHIYDGDTLKLSDGRKLRLIGINATEVGHDGKPDEPLAKAATRAVTEFIREADDHISILTDRQEKDRYGRLLAHLFNSRGDSLEQHMLEQGLAYHVAIPPNLSLAECFAAAEAKARSEGLGLWGVSGIVPVPAAEVGRGGFQRVRGTVTAMKLGKSWRLTLDNHLVAITYPENQVYFDRHWYQSLDDRFIEVQGWVYRSRGEWRIKLETPYGVLMP